jgi:antitoxin YefM
MDEAYRSSPKRLHFVRYIVLFCVQLRCIVQIDIHMKAATVSEFRAKMKQHLEDVARDQDVLILSGPRKDFVVITLATYNSMEETAHLLSTPANTAKLLESIAQDKAGYLTKKLEISESKGSYLKAARKSGKSATVAEPQIKVGRQRSKGIDIRVKNAPKKRRKS